MRLVEMRLTQAKFLRQVKEGDQSRFLEGAVKWRNHDQPQKSVPPTSPVGIDWFLEPTVAASWP
jgi:hypothetical protein